MTDATPIVDTATLTKPFPKNAIKQRQGGGGKMLDYVETHSVIHRLNEATANCWDFKVTRFEQTGDLIIALGELTIPGLGTRTGTGVQKVTERGGEDLVKGAVSDCLKKAATLFGVGLELYGIDYENLAPKPSGDLLERVHEKAEQAKGNGESYGVCVDCGSPIVGKTTGAGKVYTAEQIHDYSVKDHGRPLCNKCGWAAKKAKEATQ